MLLIDSDFYSMSNTVSIRNLLKTMNNRNSLWFATIIYDVFGLPQKRVSSGFLCLRVALLNLHCFDDGLRKGKSPHELLSGEKVTDWLGFLGYAPRGQEQRKFKKLGWKRLVKPFEVTWRENWVGTAVKPVKKKVSSEQKKELPKAA